MRKNKSIGAMTAGTTYEDNVGPKHTLQKARMDHPVFLDPSLTKNDADRRIGWLSLKNMIRLMWSRSSWYALEW